MRTFVRKFGAENIAAFLTALVFWTLVSVAFAATVTPVFPTTANDFTEGEVIEEEDWNALENTIGTTATTNKDSLFGRWNDLFSSTSLPQIGKLTGLGNVGSSTASTTFAGGLLVDKSLTVTGHTSTTNLTISGTCTGCAGISGGTAGMLASFTSATAITATGTPTATAYHATSSTATSLFSGNFTLSGTPTFSQLGTHMLTAINGSNVLVATSTPTAARYLATSTLSSIFPYASTTALTVSGTGGLYVGTLTGLLEGTSGAVGTATAGTDYIAGGVGANTQLAYFTGSGVLSSDADLTFTSGNLLTATYASSTSITTTGYAAFATGGGNVGVSTTSPAALFSVAGVGYFTGNVGIGKSAPEYLLDVRGTAATVEQNLQTSQTGASAILSQRFVAGDGPTWLVGRNPGGESITSFGVREAGVATHVAVQGTTGNTGIGTTTPNAKLNIYTGAAGSATVPDTSSDDLVIESNAAAGLTILGTAAGGQNIYFGIPGDAVAARILYDGSGNQLLIGTANASDKITFQVADQTTTLTLDSTSKVGVGTTTPSNLLSVHGSGYISSGLFVGGAVTATSTVDFGDATSLEIPNGTSPTVDAAGELAVDTTSGQLKVFDGNFTHVLTGTTSPAFNIASTSLDAKGNKFNSATSTFLLKNDPEPITLIGFYCVASSTGTALVHFADDAGNATETGSCSSGSFTRTVTNNTWTAFEGFNVVASSTKGQVSRITVTAVINKTPD